VSEATILQRAAAYLLDWVDEPVIAIGTTLWFIGHGAVGTWTAVAWTAWILVQLRRQARTGQTFGKRVVGITVVDSATLEPIGGARTALRWTVKGLDTLLPVRWLRRAFDANVATFADQVVGSSVLTIERSGQGRAHRPS
jgi:hypothetical protein